VTRAGTPGISVVTAVHDVARYLPAFFAALDGQRGTDLADVEVIAVDDGSTDDSLALLREWAGRSRLRVTVLTKPNGGQASARNLGLERASGEWVTFTDPDDTLSPGYLAAVLRFVGEHPDVALVGTKLVIHDDRSGRRLDTHPLRHRHATDRLVDLDADPGLFYASAPAAFFRRARISELGLRFDERIRPSFEDGHFCALYLLGCPRPVIGLLASARYHYRKRADGSSTQQGNFLQPERYTVVPRLGYLAALEAGAARYGRAPAWLQHLVVYELSWYVDSERRAGTSTAAAGAVGAQFVDLLRQIRRQLDDAVVDTFSARSLDPAWRQILRWGLTDAVWRSRPVVEQVDAEQRLVKVVTRFTGPEPAIGYSAGGTSLGAAHTKVRTHVYFDQVLLRERVAWLPDVPGLRVRVDGVDGLPADGWPDDAVPVRPDPAPSRGVVTRALDAVRAARRQPRHALGAVRVRARRSVLPRLARTSPVRARFGDAWVLMDRVHAADDSAEHLFRYLREHRPDVNAWFVLERGAQDWARLRAEFGNRVVGYGSLRWQLLMFSCRHLVSSHVDVPVHRPRAIAWTLAPAEPQWRFTFLQHGVIKDDISAWLNTKAMDLFVTSTPGEYASITADGTPYAVTSKEVRLTGLPRFDRLLRISESLGPADRDLVLVAPTWRTGLLGPFAPVTGSRAVRADFLDTEYARQWLAFLRSPDLADLTRRHGLRVGFLPHPLLQPALSWLGLPPHVEPLTFDGAGAQRLFAGAAVLVTDYSSMAFNAAYVDRPVVYFQFDADAIFAGGHLGRSGYFDYERDGFGPVTRTSADAVTAVGEIVGRGCAPAPEYAKRIEETLVLRDGRCCERVTAEIERLTLPALPGP